MGYGCQDQAAHWTTAEPNGFKFVYTVFFSKFSLKFQQNNEHYHHCPRCDGFIMPTTEIHFHSANLVIKIKLDLIRLICITGKKALAGSL